MLLLSCTKMNTKTILLYTYDNVNKQTWFITSFLWTRYWNFISPFPAPLPPYVNKHPHHFQMKVRLNVESNSSLLWFLCYSTSFCDRPAITNYDCFFTCSEATRPKSPMSGFQLTWTLVICEVFCHYKPQPTSFTFSFGFFGSCGYLSLGFSYPMLMTPNKAETAF